MKASQTKDQNRQVSYTSGPTINSYAASYDASTGLEAITFMPCFCKGSLIRTVAGDVPIEKLVIGDSVVTWTGQHRPITWIGFRSLDLTRHPAPDDVSPLRIIAGALGNGMPARDSLISPDHAVLVRNRLVPARLLLNGASVRREPAARRVTYFHVELDQHDILIAEGAPAESFLDTGNRSAFENAGLQQRLRPDFAGDQQRREARSCRPLVTAPQDSEPIWRAVAERAKAMGCALPAPPAQTEEPDLHVLADGRRIEPVLVGDGASGRPDAIPKAKRGIGHARPWPIRRCRR